MTINKSIQYFKNLFGCNENKKGSDSRKFLLNLDKDLINMNNNSIRNSVSQCSSISLTTSSNNENNDKVSVNSECKEFENITTRQNSNITITNLVISVKSNKIKENLQQQDNNKEYDPSTSSPTSLFPEIDYDQFDPNSPNYISILPCSFPIIH